MTDRTKRLFFVLWGLGIAGVLSFLLVDINALIAITPLPEDQKSDLPPWYLLKLASVVQPAILTTVAVIVGIWLADKVGLHSPSAEAFAERRNVIRELRPQIVPGIIAGILAGAAIVACWLVFRPFLDAEFIARSEAFNKTIPAAVRFLYGGLTEEVLLRWGMMTFLVWSIWRSFGRGSELPVAWAYVGAIAISALFFGIGHLPVASLLAGGLTVPLSLFVIIANSIFGIIAGILYWRFGLESAMIGHIFAHVVLLFAIELAL